MSRYRFILFLVILVGISSCDMSRWYFRHGGKNRAAKSQTEIPQTVEFREDESAQSSYQDALILSREDTPVLPLAKEDSPTRTNDPKTIENRDNGMDVSPDSEVATQIQQSDQFNDSGSVKRMHTNPGPFILLLILVFILGLALIGTLIFLISWIFVPIAIALRIALWGLLIVFGLYLLLFLGLALFSN